MKEYPSKEVSNLNSQDRTAGPSIEEYLHEINILKQTIEISKDTCSMYQTDAVLAKAKAKDIEKEMGNLKSLHKEEIDKLQTQISEIKAKSKQEMDDILKQYSLSRFEDFKIKAQKEIEIREMLNNRQDQHIEKLQEEIKNAKIVLQTPTLRLKVFDRLKDYMTEHDKIPKESKENQPKSKPPEGKVQSSKGFRNVKTSQGVRKRIHSEVRATQETILEDERLRSLNSSAVNIQEGTEGTDRMVFQYSRLKSALNYSRKLNKSIL
jgi:hypothetical protein